jgi:hypothetical protein
MSVVRYAVVLAILCAGLCGPATIEGAAPVSADAPPYQLAVARSMEKVQREGQYDGKLGSTLRLELARNEYGGAQIVVANVTRDVHGLRAEASPLRSAKGTIPASCVTVRQVGYVHTVKCDAYPQTRIGLWPDPLLELPQVDVPAGKVQPLWVTIHVPKEAPAGEYRGTITLRADDAPATRVEVMAKVWDVTLPERPKFRAMALDGPRTDAAYDLLLAHRMSPAYALCGWSWDRPQPPVVRRDDGAWDFSAADQIAEHCVPRGMNAFVISHAPKPGKYGFPEDYSAEYRARFAEFLKAYTDHLRAKGWLKLGMTYNIDEAAPKLWDLCKENYRQAKAIAPDVPMMQCLNEPKGVAALAGFADIWDVYITQFQQAGVPARMQAGDQGWFAICCYPATHPNLFTDYPALDARMVGWLSWKAGVSGFEYWSASSWGENPTRLAKGYLDEIESDWQANTFGKYNGDGYLMYPGPEGKLLSSIRLENLRDGFQDWELLAMLKERGGPRAAELLRLDGLCQDDMSFTNDPEVLLAQRHQVLAALAATAPPGRGG